MTYLYRTPWPTAQALDQRPTPTAAQLQCMLSPASDRAGRHRDDTSLRILLRRTACCLDEGRRRGLGGHRRRRVEWPGGGVSALAAVHGAAGHAIRSLRRDCRGARRTLHIRSTIPSHVLHTLAFPSVELHEGRRRCRSDALTR